MASWRRLIRLRRTTVLCIGLGLFLAGLGIARLRPEFDASLFYLAAIICIVGMLAARRSKAVLVIGLLLVALMAGWWRGSVYIDKLDVYDELIRQNVTLRAEAEEDAVYSDRGQLTFRATKLKVEQPLQTDLVGSIVVEGRGTPMVYRGDIVRVEGKMYPRRGLQQAGISYGTITTVTKNDSVIENIRREFAAALQNVLPEPLASFSLGLLIGQRSTLPEEINQELTTTGLIHIVAVSGYNLTVIINVSRKLMARRSRFQALALSLMLIVLFIFFTGYEPSIVRAGLVSTLTLLAWYFGRQIKPMLILLIVAAVTAGVYPIYLWSSVGWYLSFTAFFGVLVLAPLLAARFLPKKLHDKILPSIGIETTAAQLCTLPIILFVFGRLSIISIVANLIIGPLVPFAMLFSFIAGVVGMVAPVIGAVVAIPARLLLEFMLSVSSLLSRVPFAQVEIKISWRQMMYLYAIIIALTIALWLRQKRAKPNAVLK